MIYNPRAYLESLKAVYAQEAHAGLDFWADHGVDWEEGGIITYLDRCGRRYCDEKNGWFVGRGMYSFAKGYNDICKDPRWLAAAENCYDFMMKHQFLPDGKRLYYNMLKDGTPADSDPRAGHYKAASPALHCETFALMGLSELYKATGRQDVYESMRGMFRNTRFLYQNPEYMIDGTLNTTGTQPKVGVATLMSLLCSTQTVRGCDPDNEAEYTAALAEYCDMVYKYYFDASRPMIAEAVMDCPGHNMEVAWFMLAEGMYTGNQKLIDDMTGVIRNLWKIGWDEKFGGFFLYANMEGSTFFSQFYDMKYWWTNNELEIGLLYSYVATGDMDFLEKFRRCHDWNFSHFPDREYGEWYPYLHRDGTPVVECKGDNQKGPYHLYRSFYAMYNLIDAYLKKTAE